MLDRSRIDCRWVWIFSWHEIAEKNLIICRSKNFCEPFSLWALARMVAREHWKIYFAANRSFAYSKPGAEVEFPPFGRRWGESRADGTHCQFYTMCMVWLGEIYFACARARGESWQLWTGSWCFNTEKFVAFFSRCVGNVSWDMPAMRNSMKLMKTSPCDRRTFTIVREPRRRILFRHFSLRPSISPHIYCAHFHINRFFDENAEKFFASRRI